MDNDNKYIVAKYSNIQILMINLFNFISKNLKYIVYTILLSSIFLFFSFHLFIKYSYWTIKYPLPKMIFVDVEYTVKSENDALNSKKPPKIYLIQKNKDGKYVVDKEFTNNHPVKFHITNYPFTTEYDNLNFLANYDGYLTYKFIGQEIIKSFKVNDEEIAVDGTNYKYKIEIKKNKIYDTFFIHKLPGFVNDSDIGFKYFLSVTAIIMVFLVYLTLFGFLFYKLSKIKNKKEWFLRWLQTNKIPIIVFVFCLTLYTLLYIFVIQKIDFFYYYNAIYSADSNLRIIEIMQSFSRRYHLYYFLPFYPFFEFFFFITKNLILSLMMVFCILASLSAVFIEKTLNLIIPENRKLTLLLTMIFIFSYVQIVMTQTFEVYNITGFYISLFVYLVIKYLKKGGFTVGRIVILGILGALTFGVSYPNLLTFLIILLPILISQKHYKKIILLIVTIILSISFFFFLKIQVSPQTKDLFLYNRTQQEFAKWWKLDLMKNLSNFKTESLYRPLLALDVKNINITNNIMMIFWYIFALMIIIGLFKISKNKNNKDTDTDNIIMYESLIMALITNLFFNFCWCSIYGFTFCQNYFILEFYIFTYAIKFIGENIDNEKLKNKILFSLLLLFLLIEIPINILDNNRVQNEAVEKYPMDYEFFMRDLA